MRPSLKFWLVWLAILGIIAVLFYAITPRIGRGHQARRTAAFTDINGGIKSAIEQYKADNGFYPKSLQELVQKSVGSTNWHGPYLDNLPIDPWGNQYVYEYPGTHNTDSYDLFSAGPDSRVGTEDDLGNWQK